MTRAFPVLALTLFLGTAVAAHHPFAAEYDWKKPVTITGKVVSFDWKNPHSMLVVAGRDDSGKDAQWTIELGGPGQLERMGWKSAQFKPGDQVTVDGWMAKAGGNKLSAKSVTPAGGSELFAASSFFDSQQQASAASPKKTQGTTGTQTPKPTSTVPR